MRRECSDVQDGTILRARGYRKTPQRLLILSVLQASQTRLTLWQILERVHEQRPGVSSSTLYRSLEILEAAHLVRRTLLPGEGVTYQAVRGCGEEHYLVCQRCQQIIAFVSSTSSPHSRDSWRRSIAFMKSMPRPLLPGTATSAGPWFANPSETPSVCGNPASPSFHSTTTVRFMPTWIVQ